MPASGSGTGQKGDPYIVAEGDGLYDIAEKLLPGRGADWKTVLYKEDGTHFTDYDAAHLWK